MVWKHQTLIEWCRSYKIVVLLFWIVISSSSIAFPSFSFFVPCNLSLTNIFFGIFSAKIFQRRSRNWCWRTSYIKTPSLGILWTLSAKNTLETKTIVTIDSIISQHKSSACASFDFFIERFAVKTVLIVILETGFPPPHHLACNRKVKVNIWIW